MASKPDKEISNVTDEDMLEALKRSGYIFESEVVSMLVEKGYTVESNVLYEDVNGEKKFEIDLIVELYNTVRRRKRNIFLTLNLIFELKNYDSPLVLLTKEEDYLNSYHNYYDKEYIFHIADKYKSSIVNSWSKYSFKNKMFDNYSRFRQYCVFQKNIQNKKSDTLIATQDEKIHKAIQNLHQYCLEQIFEFDYGTNDNGNISIIYYLPILLLKNRIYEFRKSGELFEVDESRLLIRSIYNGEVKNSLMYICNQKKLLIMIERISSDFNKLLKALSTAKIEDED